MEHFERLSIPFEFSDASSLVWLADPIVDRAAFATPLPAIG